MSFSLTGLTSYVNQNTLPLMTRAVFGAKSISMANKMALIQNNQMSFFYLFFLLLLTFAVHRDTKSLFASKVDERLGNKKNRTEIDAKMRGSMRD